MSEMCPSLSDEKEGPLFSLLFSRGSGFGSAREADADRKGEDVGLSFLSLANPEKGKMQASMLVPHSSAHKYKTGTGALEDSWAISHKMRHMSQQLHSLVFSQFVENVCSYKTCSLTFTVALVIIAKTQKHQKCPPIGEWRDKLWYVHSMENYTVIKRAVKLEKT